MKKIFQPGYFLEALLLEGDPKQSEGLYRFDHWAVRLGCDPNSPQARMATLHEMYHGLLNDSTAYGTLLHAVGLLAREQPSEVKHAQLLNDLIERCRTVHEIYATYSSVFLLGQGRCDPALVEPYPDYPSYLGDALEIANLMPNPAIGFQFVQSAIRAAMQPDCLSLFASTPAEDWNELLLRLDVGVPNERFSLLRNPVFLRSAVEELSRWSGAQTDPLVREVLDACPKSEVEYDNLIREELDPATDLIGAYLYELCRGQLQRLGQSCLTYNGHQSHTAEVLAEATRGLPQESARRLAAAPEGSRLDDLLSGFAQERLVISPERMRGRWLRLEDIPEEKWSTLLVGPKPHALVVVRSSLRLEEQYDFGASGAPPGDSSRAVVAVRRRAIELDGRATIEFVVICDAEQLQRFSERVASSAPVLASCAMSILGDAEWQSAWLPVLRQLAHFDVLVDLDPFEYVRAWAHKNEFVTAFTTMNLDDGTHKRMVMALRPNADGDLIFLAPCTSVFCSAMVVELRTLMAAGAPFEETAAPFDADMGSLVLILSHLFREEPWFDFRAGALPK